jgi:hypothetical protein
MILSTKISSLGQVTSNSVVSGHPAIANIDVISYYTGEDCRCWDGWRDTHADLGTINCPLLSLLQQVAGVRSIIPPVPCGRFHSSKWHRISATMLCRSNVGTNNRQLKNYKAICSGGEYFLVGFINIFLTCIYLISFYR